MYPVTQDFIDKMKADRRRVLARVEVDYTDPFMDQSLTIEANEQANVSYPQQTADSVDQTARKYACLDGTWDLTSGEYHLAPSANQLTEQQFGWWGAQFSDVFGYFAQPYPMLIVRHSPRPIRQLKVVGDTAREEYPVDFNIRLYGPDDTLLKTETVTGNTQVSWSKALEPQVLDVAKQVLEITKWSRPGTCAKIVEFFTSIRETYETGDLVSVRLLEEREASRGSLPVGNISSNEITLVLSNADKKFDLDNENSPLKNLLKPNRRIQAWLGAEAENITAENPPTFTRNSIAYLSNGTQVAANKPRFEQGAPGFGKAIMLEEGTTNLVNINNFTFANGASLVDIVHPVTGKTVKAIKLPQGANAPVAFSQYLNLSTSTNYTVSFDLWASDNSNTAINIDLYPDTLPETSKTPTTNVQRHTWTLSSSNSDMGNCRLRFFDNTSQPMPNDVYIAMIQLEQKPYATSFIDGTRAGEILKLFNHAQTIQYFPANASWRLGLRIKVNNTDKSRTRAIYSCTEGGGFNLYYHGAENRSRIAMHDGTGYKLLNFLTPYPFDDLQWHKVDLVYDYENHKARLYLDGVKQSETDITQLHYGAANYAFFLGTENANGAGSTTEILNGLIDDVIISRYVPTDEEILAEAQSNKPLPVDEWTTYKLSFDGHLYRSIQGTAWIPLGTFWSLDWDSPDDSLEATVVARDRMELLRKSTFQTSQVLTNKSLYELAEIVLRDAGLTSDQYIIDPALQSIIIPYAWFNPVSHREALRKIAEAGLAAAFQNRDGKIQIESFLLSGDEPVLEITEDDYFPPLRAPSRQDQVANEIIVDTQPLRPATTSEEVYRSNEPVMIPANSTQTLTVYYNKTPVIDAVATLDSPPAGVAITEATYYGWGASIKIANSTGTDQQVTLVIAGRPLSVQNKERAVARDEASILENGLLTYEFPANPLVQTLAQAQAIANTLLASVKDPRRDIEVEWRGNPALLLGDRVTVKGKDYHVIRQEIDWQGYLQARLTGRKAE